MKSDILWKKIGEIDEFVEKYKYVPHHIYIAYYMFKHRIGCDFENEELVGGWTSSIPGKAIVLEDKLDKAFTKAQSELVGVTYYPVVAFEKDDTYAIICLGRMSDLNGTTNVYVMTINTNGEKLAIAGVDLKDFNK